MHRVREGFLKEAETYPHVAVIDATQEIDGIQQAIRAAVSLRLKEMP